VLVKKKRGKRKPPPVIGLARDFCLAAPTKKGEKRKRRVTMRNAQKKRGKKKSPGEID